MGPRWKAIKEAGKVAVFGTPKDTEEQARKQQIQLEHLTPKPIKEEELRLVNAALKEADSRAFFNRYFQEKGALDSAEASSRTTKVLERGTPEREALMRDLGVTERDGKYVFSSAADKVEARAELIAEALKGPKAAEVLTYLHFNGFVELSKDIHLAQEVLGKELNAEIKNRKVIDAIRSSSDVSEHLTTEEAAADASRSKKIVVDTPTYKLAEKYHSAIKTGEDVAAAVDELVQRGLIKSPVPREGMIKAFVKEVKPKIKVTPEGVAGFTGRWTRRLVIAALLVGLYYGGKAGYGHYWGDDAAIRQNTAMVTETNAEIFATIRKPGFFGNLDPDGTYARFVNDKANEPVIAGMIVEVNSSAKMKSPSRLIGYIKFYLQDPEKGNDEYRTKLKDVRKPMTDDERLGYGRALEFSASVEDDLLDETKAAYLAPALEKLTKTEREYLDSIVELKYFLFRRAQELHEAGATQDEINTDFETTVRFAWTKKISNTDRKMLVEIIDGKQATGTGFFLKQAELSAEVRENPMSQRFMDLVPGNSQLREGMGLRYYVLSKVRGLPEETTDEQLQAIIEKISATVVNSDDMMAIDSAFFARKVDRDIKVPALTTILAAIEVGAAPSTQRAPASAPVEAIEPEQALIDAVRRNYDTKKTNAQILADLNGDRRSLMRTSLFTQEFPNASAYTPQKLDEYIKRPGPQSYLAGKKGYTLKK